MYGRHMHSCDVSQELSTHVTPRFGRKHSVCVIERGFVLWLGVSIATGFLANYVTQEIVIVGGETEVHVGAMVDILEV